MGKKKKAEPLFNVTLVAAQISRCLMLDLDEGVHINEECWKFFQKAQNTGLLKKYIPLDAKLKQKELRAAAIDRFLSVNNRFGAGCFSVDGCVNTDLRSPEKVDPYDRILTRARSLMHQILGDFSLEELFLQCKHGPNTSQGVAFCDSGLSAKFQLPVTATESVISMADAYLRWDVSLSEMLQRSNPDLVLRHGWTPHTRLVSSSKLTTVPKNDETDRTIAIEPTLNMFFQQGFGVVIRNRLLEFGLDLKSLQPEHQRQAYLGSILRDRATIDWSSASDCVSITVLKFLLPPIWFMVMDACRCKTVDVDGVEHPLHIFSTMGNATTFVLETLVFFVLASACVDERLTPNRSRFVEYEAYKSVTVFGDDCILPCVDAPLFISICTRLGFIVNERKSFIYQHEKFRESCGGDYYAGVDVRPVFISGPRSLKPSVLRAWLYTQWNVLIKRLITSLGERNYVYSHTLKYLASVISKYNREILAIPGTDPDDAGLKTFGDWCRINFLFSKPLASMKIDVHGTVRYQKLISASPAAGTFVQEIEYWDVLRKLNRRSVPLAMSETRPRTFFQLLTTLDFPEPFEALKQDGGYVVSRGCAFVSPIC